MIKNIILINRHLADINPIECGEETCPPEFHIGPASRPYFLLHYVFSGSGVFQMDGREHTVSAGQISVLHPHETVYYRTDPNNPWHYSWIGFETALEVPLLWEQDVLDLKQAEHIFLAFRSSDQVAANREYYICGKIFELLSMLQRPEPAASKASALVERAKKYIESNFGGLITVEQLSADLYVNRSYFSTVFKKHTGHSPQQYLQNVRLENAADLLANQNASVGLAASKSGYDDLYHFSKMFKKKFGVPPTAYKKSRRD